jgi:hypothetical protein
MGSPFDDGLRVAVGFIGRISITSTFATDLGALGLLGWRRKRKAQAVA